jgi:hypothetical protein
MDTTCDYSVTGRWNIVNLAISDANVVRGGAGEATQSLVLSNAATQYDEYIPGNVQLQITFLSSAISYQYQVNVFMAGFEEITMVVGAGISMHVDYIPETTKNAKVIFKNDCQPVGWSVYAQLPTGSTTFTFTGIAFKVTMTLEANNVYLVAFNADGAVTMVQAETGAPSNLRHIHAATTCQKPTSPFFSNTTSPIIDSVAYGTGSEYVTTEKLAGYYKYVVVDEDGVYRCCSVQIAAQSKLQLDRYRQVRP